MEIKLEKHEVKEILVSLVDFYKDLETIKDYFLEKKKEVTKDVDTSLLRDNFFNDYTLPPKDYKITIEEMPHKLWMDMVLPLTSMPLENQIGRRIMLGVKEETTGMYLGFLRIASPCISIGPRNDLFNGVKLNGSMVNGHMYNGSIIVPVQPFGYNALGGKLLSLISCSHQVREMFNEKYGDKGVNICWWETTSLYGDIKGVSQYDGLKPFVRYSDLTESDVFIFPTDEVYKPLLDRMREEYGVDIWDGKLAEPYDKKRGFNKSAPKMREFNKFLSILKHHIKEYWGQTKLNDFNKFVKEKMKSKTKKRFYYSSFGYENTKEYITGEDTELREGQNYHKHNLDYMIEWWKKKAQKRWEKLNKEDRIKKDLEYYTFDKINEGKVDMIR